METVHVPIDTEPEEVELGNSTAAISVNAFLRSFSRVARSFATYDPHNDAIRSFLQDLHDQLHLALRHGTIELIIRPFEMVWRGEVIYLERRRERSLAWRMFRDGVRKLIIDPEVSWEEILKLLEIISIRYVGLRQREDDVVTLMNKASFQAIGVEAVEGFLLDEEDTTNRLWRQPPPPGARMEVPPDWDLPLPQRTQPVLVHYQEVSPLALQTRASEVEPNALAPMVVRLAEEMLRAVDDKVDPTELRDILHYLEEARLFLFAEYELPHLVRLAQALHSTQADITQVLLTFLTSPDLEALIRHVAGKGPVAPPELLSLVDLSPIDHLPFLVDLLHAEAEENIRAVVRTLVASHAEKHAEYIYRRLQDAPGTLACDLLQICVETMPDKGVHAAILVANHVDRFVQTMVLDVLRDGPINDQIFQALTRFLSSPDEQIRLRAISLLPGKGKGQVVSVLAQHTERNVLRGFSPQEARVIGEAMAAANPSSAQATFSRWIEPPNFFRRWVEMPGEQTLWWVAVSGLGLLPGDEAERLIKEVQRRAPGDLRDHCTATLVRRRHTGVAHHA